MVGRNDMCPCGSGKKYKKCCLAKDEAKEIARNKIIYAQKKFNATIEKIEEFSKREEYKNYKSKFNTDFGEQSYAIDRAFFTYYLANYKYNKQTSIMMDYFSRNKPNLNEYEVEIIEEALNSYVSIYQVKEKDVNKVLLRDIILEQSIYVDDIDLFENFDVGNYVLARIASVDNIKIFLDQTVKIDEDQKNRIKKSVGKRYGETKNKVKTKKQCLIKNIKMMYQYIVDIYIDNLKAEKKLIEIKANNTSNEEADRVVLEMKNLSKAKDDIFIENNIALDQEIACTKIDENKKVEVSIDNNFKDDKPKKDNKAENNINDKSKKVNKIEININNNSKKANKNDKTEEKLQQVQQLEPIVENSLDGDEIIVLLDEKNNSIQSENQELKSEQIEAQELEQEQINVQELKLEQLGVQAVCQNESQEIKSEAKKIKKQVAARKSTKSRVSNSKSKNSNKKLEEKLKERQIKTSKKEKKIKEEKAFKEVLEDISVEVEPVQNQELDLQDEIIDLQSKEAETQNEELKEDFELEFMGEEAEEPEEVAENKIENKAKSKKKVEVVNIKQKSLNKSTKDKNSKVLGNEEKRKNSKIYDILLSKVENEYVDECKAAWENFQSIHKSYTGNEIGWAAAIEYFVKKNMDDTITQEQISKKYNVSSRTLSKRYKELQIS